MSNHYVFLKPGEKVFILTDDVAGDSDYTYVVEAEIPVDPLRDPEGHYHHPETGRIVDVRQYQVLELNDCANLTYEYNSTLLDAYARDNEKRLGNNPDDAFVAKPLGESQQLQVKAG